MMQILNYISVDRIQECFNDLNYYRDELRILFRNGQINLLEISKIEKTYLYILNKIKKFINEKKLNSSPVACKINNLAIYSCVCIFCSFECCSHHQYP